MTSDTSYREPSTVRHMTNNMDGFGNIEIKNFRGIDYLKFEQAAYEVNQIECWSARELQKLLGYSKWETMIVAI